MPEYLSPGVYVEEFESGSRPMEGVSTSTAGFIGLAEKGTVEGLPELVTNAADFQRKFGGYLSQNEFGDYRYLAYAVEHFFINGGGRCYVMRVAPSDAKPSKNFSEDMQDKTVLCISAKNPGIWGDKVRVKLYPSSKAKTQIYKVMTDPASTEVQYLVKNGAGFNPGDVVMFYDGEKGEHEYSTVKGSQDNILTLAAPLAAGEGAVDTALLPKKVLTTCEFSMQVAYRDLVELYENVSLNIGEANFVEKMVSKSNIITVSVNNQGAESVPPFKVITAKEEFQKAGDSEKIDLNSEIIALSGGSNGSIKSITAADFMGKDDGPGKRSGIKAFIDNDEVSLMAVPGVTDPDVQLFLIAHCESLASRFAVLDIPREKKTVADVQTHRNIFDSNYAAMYNPWLQVFDPLEKRNVFIPPSGPVLGIYARVDNSRGVHKAPANEVVRACSGLDCQYNKGEQDILNPKGVNLIRYFTGEGIRVWGARTCTSNSLWKYINVRRLFIYLEESIKKNTNWVVFEPNDQSLWDRVQRTIENFLTTVWRSGALMGNAPAEAFFVKVDRTTMSQDDIDNGRLICVIGVAPVKPAEFVIFRITQKTGDQQ
ncbi:MAG TPA: phage tail sheath family protein [Ruminiclostridium sp.]|nr:phage tail sheath family protein [Ruminiclostridium sp.]